MESATKAPQSVRPAEKVLQALSTLAALIDSTIREVKSLDNEFQSRLLQAVHDTEASLQAQSAEHVERARQELKEELNAKFQNDIQVALDGVKSEFETERERFNKELSRVGETAAQLELERSGLIAQVQQVKADSAAAIEKAHEELKNAVHKTEVLLQAESAESIQRARQEVQDELNSKYRRDLQAAMESLKAEFEIERDRLGQELLQTVQATSKLESERSGLIAEVQRVKADSAAELEKAHQDLKNAVHKTEVSLQQESAENIRRARQEVQDELGSKYRNDLQAAMDGLKSGFGTERERLNKELLQTVQTVSKLESEKSGLMAEVQQVKADASAELEKAREELKNAVHKTEVSLQTESVQSIQRARQEVQDELGSKYRKDLQAATDGLKSEFETERERLNKDLLLTVQTVSKLESERSELIAQVQQVKTDSSAELEKAREELKNTVHKTEVSLQTQSAESIRHARQEVQDELSSKYRKDLEAAMDGLKAEFETERERLNKELQQTVQASSRLEAERSGLIAQVQQVKADSAAEIEKAHQDLKNAVHKTEVSLQAETAQSIAHARQEVQDELNIKYRKDLQTALEGLKSEFDVERDRLNKELLHTVEAASKLEAERSGLIAEVQQVKADSATELEKARKEAKAAVAKQPPPVASSAPSVPSASLQQEIESTEARLHEILKLIENPVTELSTVIRKNVEKSELEAYLRGIRLVLNGKN